MIPWRKVLTVIIGVFFIVSAISKCFDLRDFELYIFSMGMLGFDYSSLVARCLIILELGTGLWLLMGWFPAGARVLAATEIVLFSSVLIWRIAVGDSRSCHCLGNLINLKPAASLVKNGILIIGILLCSPGNWRIPKGALLVFLLTASAGVALFALDPPDFWFRLNGRVSSDIVPERLEPLLLSRNLNDRKLIAFFSTRCSHCRDCAAKLEGVLERCESDRNNVYLFFLAVSDSTDSEVTHFQQDYMGGLQYTFEILQPTEMFPVTNGSMPIIALCDDGQLVQEFDLLTMDEIAIKDFLEDQIK